MTKNLALTQFWPLWPKFRPYNFFFVNFTSARCQHCCKLSLYAISRKTNEPNLRKQQKKLSFGSDFGLFGQNLGHQFFFFSQKNLAPSVPRYYGQLSSCTISEKTDNPILRKLSDGGTNGPTDGQTDGRSDFIGRCPTNVERPIITIINSRLQVQRCKQQTTSSKVQTACYKFKSANSRLQVQRYKQLATRSKVQTAVKTCKIQRQ